MYWLALSLSLSLYITIIITTIMIYTNGKENVKNILTRVYSLKKKKKNNGFCMMGPRFRVSTVNIIVRKKKKM